MSDESGNVGASTFAERPMSEVNDAPLQGKPETVSQIIDELAQVPPALLHDVAGRLIMQSAIELITSGGQALSEGIDQVLGRGAGKPTQATVIVLLARVAYAMARANAPARHP